MADLHWFPVFIADWLTSDAITLMLPEQEGAFFRLLLRAWGKGAVEPSIPADDASLATLSRLGKRWGKLGGLVREQFEERDGRLYNAKLSEVWTEQQQKHDSAVERGKLGGRSKAAKDKQISSSATAKPKKGSSKALANSKQLESELELEEAKPLPAAPDEGSSDALPKPFVHAIYTAWTQTIGDVNYGRLVNALSPRFKAKGERPTLDQMLGAIQAFADIRAADGPSFRATKYTITTFMQSLPEWIRLGSMQLVDEWGEPTERGQAAKVFA